MQLDSLPAVVVISYNVEAKLNWLAQIMTGVGGVATASRFINGMKKTTLISAQDHVRRNSSSWR